MPLPGTISGVEQVAGSAPVPIPSTLTPRNPELMIWVSQAPTMAPHLEAREVNFQILNVTYLIYKHCFD